jgi:class 3 adenylate cyclase
MFCDLVASTELATRLDPEELREVITAYHRAVADAVKSFDGFVESTWAAGYWSSVIPTDRLLADDLKPASCRPQRRGPQRQFRWRESLLLQ